MLKLAIIMKISNEDLEKKAREALSSCLSRVPFLKIEKIEREVSKDSVRPDFVVKLIYPEGVKNLILEIKANGQPRLARQAVNQILRYKELYSDSYGVFLAPYISPKAGEICKREGIGYLDFSGNCYLCFDRVFIEQEGRPNIFQEKRDLRSLYSPRAERVLRVLLNNPIKVWKVGDLAEAAQVSLGQVSNVKKRLMDREWIQEEKIGFRLNEPEQLLKEWGENYSFRKNKILDFYSLKTVAQIEADLIDYCNRNNLIYAFTGFSGAARLASAVRYQRAMTYLEDLNDTLISALALKRVESGSNVTLSIPYDEGVFYGARQLEGAQIASPVQLYLDLRSFRGRGEEAAQILFEQVIKPKW
jgi:hypothetical protein